MEYSYDSSLPMVTKIIDLTYNIEEGMVTYNAPWHPLVSIQQLGRIGVEGRETRKITLGTHTGTHMDAPLHFIKEGRSIDNIPLSKMLGEVTILDFTNMNENEGVTKEMLMKYPITQRMIFKFGWGKFWGSKKFYEGYPFFTKDAANFLIANKVELIGFDTPSPDDSRGGPRSAEDSPIHKILLGNGVILVEYLANLDSVTDYDGWKLVAAPLKIKSGDGGPSRVFIYK